MRILFWKASLAVTLLLSACNVSERVPVEMVGVDQSRPIGKETALQADIDIDVGTLEIQGDSPSNLYSYNLEYDKGGYEPELRYDAGNSQLFLKLPSTHRGGIRSERNTNRLQLKLTEAIPLRLKVNMGVGEARLALSRLKVSRLDLEGGVGAARINTYDANPIICDEIRLRNGVGSLDAVGLGNLNFRVLDFEGGVGGANLDLSGAWKQDAEIRIQVGLGGMNLRVPRELGVRVTAEKHLLSGLQLENFRREGSSDDYYSENYNQSKIRITVSVKTGIGGFKISWI
jgi:hypothetical protein